MPATADLRTDRGLVAPARSIEWVFARSGGPGGQHVNTTSSKATLLIDLRQLQGAPDTVARVLAALGDELRVTCQTHRSQLRNREDCLVNAAEQIDAAARRPPPPRRATRPTRGSVDRRLESKRRTSHTKRGRSGDW
jgi:ribosome-associated protein